MLPFTENSKKAQAQSKQKPDPKLHCQSKSIHDSCPCPVNSLENISLQPESISLDPSAILQAHKFGLESVCTKQEGESTASIQSVTQSNPKLGESITNLHDSFFGGAKTRLLDTDLSNIGSLVDKHYSNPELKFDTPADHLLSRSAADCQFEQELPKVMRLFTQMNQVPVYTVAKSRPKLIKHLKRLELGKLRVTGLEGFMLKFFGNDPISQADVDTLGPVDKLVFMAVLVKKRYPDADDFDFRPETIGYFRMKSTVKRKEQQYKFVLKKCFKALIRKFDSGQTTNRQAKKKLKTEFYRHYFGELVEHSELSLADICLENIFNEQKSRLGSQKKSKKTVARLLRANPKFVRELTDFLDGKCVWQGRPRGVKLEAISEISRKMKLLVSRWKQSLLGPTDQPTDARVADFLIGFFANKRIKLPWSIRENEQAIESVKELLQLD